MIHFHPLGDQAIQLVFGYQIDEDTHKQILHYMALLQEQTELPITEAVPAYTTITLYYDALKISYDELKLQLRSFTNQLQNSPKVKRYIIEIPVLYGGDYGPDLADVASYHQLSIEEVISLHSSRPYLVYMLGFAPGFPYLGGLSPRIATPRLSRPRARVAAGSVGIAGSQTGVYSIESPGGWRIIGRTPLHLYDPENEQPILLNAGDYVRFVPIGLTTFLELQNARSICQEVQINRYIYSECEE